jgi:hypothetical protein
MKNEVVLELRGGLGNQLFQYAAGVALSKKLNVPLRISTSLLPDVAKLDGQVSAWPNQLNNFRHLGEVLETSGMPLLRNKFAYSRIRQLQRMIGDHFPKLLLFFGQFSNEVNSNFELFKEITRPVLINSYCSDPAFFADVADLVAESIMNLETPSRWYNEMQTRISLEKPIGVHIRLGDYLNLESIYGAPRPEYVMRAINLIKQTHPKKPVWLFSDDVTLATKLFSQGNTFDHVVVSPSESNALENLILLSKCSSLVATNSTFSWWAAFLGHRDSSTVIFPRPLFPIFSQPDPKEYLMPAWLQLGG